MLSNVNISAPLQGCPFFTRCKSVYVKFLAQDTPQNFFSLLKLPLLVYEPKRAFFVSL